MVPDRFGEGAEYDAFFGQVLLKSGLDGDGVDHGIDGYTGEGFLFVERDAEFLEGGPQFGIDFVHAAFEFFVFTGGGIVDDLLVVDRRDGQVGPVRHGHGLPFPVGFEPEVEQPFGFFLEGGYFADDLFAQSFADGFGVDVGGESVFVFALRGVFDDLSFFHVKDVLQLRVPCKRGAACVNFTKILKNGSG